MKNIILASQSPRRKQLMELAGFTVRTIVSAVEEIYPESLSKKEVASFLAKVKSHAVWESLTLIEKNQSIVVASDTIVYLNDEIFGKPLNREMAINYLLALSGKTHYVITGVSIISNKGETNFDDAVAVSFKELTQEEIIYYVDHYKPYDKAGAYAIQEWIGAIGIAKISGDYYSVMGLPINRVYTAINEHQKV